MKIKISLCILALLLVAACTATPTTEPDDGVSDEPIKIGFIGPLSGAAAHLGETSKVAVEMAVEEINAEGGINGRNLEVIYEDGICNGAYAVDAANKLMNIDGVPIIIGGACSSETLAFADAANTAGVTVLSYCSSNPAVTDAGDYIFRDYPSDSFQGVFAAEHLYEQGKRNVAVISCLGDWCQGIREVFIEKFSSYPDTQIVADEKFEKDSKDIRGQLTKIKNADPDTIYWLGWKISSVAGLKQAEELGLDVFIFGGDAWNDPGIAEEAGVAANGHQFTWPRTPSGGDFVTKMQERTGKKDVTLCAPQAYDAAHIVANLMRGGAMTSDEIRDALYAMEPYDGVSGIVEFDENGDPVNAEYSIGMYQDGEIVVVME